MPPKKTPSAPTSPAKQVTAKTILPRKAAAPAKKTAANKQPSKKPSAPKQAGRFYVSFASVGATISTEKPKGAKSPPAFDTFEQAKAAAIDALVEAIETAETQLLALKRAGAPADLGG